MCETIETKGKPKDEPAVGTDATVESKPSKPQKAKAKAKAKPKANKDKDDPVATHSLAWDDIELSFKLPSSGKELNFKFKKPSLHPNREVPAEKRLHVDLRRAPFTWETDALDRIRPLWH